MTTLHSKPLAVAYYRSSVQLPHVQPISYQQRRVSAWARLHHVDVVREFVELEPSPSDSNPLPAFVEMIRWLQQRDDIRFILCSDLSRIGRFPSQAADIAGCGKQVVSVTTMRFAPLDP